MWETSLSRQELSSDTQYAMVCGLTGKKWFVLRHATKHTQPPSQPWPTPAEMAPLCPKWGIKPCNNTLHGWATTHRASGYNFGESEGVYCHQSAHLFQRWCIATTLECFEGHTPPQPYKNYVHLLRGSSPIEQWWRCGVQGLMWGARGPFLPALVMVSCGWDGRCWPLEAGDIIFLIHM